MKIYALKPFEADIGSICPDESMTVVSTAGGRGSSDDVIVAPATTTFGYSDITLWTDPPPCTNAKQITCFPIFQLQGSTIRVQYTWYPIVNAATVNSVFELS